MDLVNSVEVVARSLRVPRRSADPEALMATPQACEAHQLVAPRSPKIRSMSSQDPTAFYDDGSVRLDRRGIRLSRYYFPLGRPRNIAWSELHGYKVQAMTAWNGRFRGWGSHRPDRWFQLDLRRRHKRRMIVLQVQGTKPVITPDDVDIVCRLMDLNMTPPDHS